MFQIDFSNYHDFDVIEILGKVLVADMQCFLVLDNVKK